MTKRDRVLADFRKYCEIYWDLADPGTPISWVSKEYDSDSKAFDRYMDAGKTLDDPEIRYTVMINMKRYGLLGGRRNEPLSEAWEQWKGFLNELAAK